jgi:hypothetical protein
MVCGGECSCFTAAFAELPAVLDEVGRPNGEIGFLAERDACNLTYATAAPECQERPAWLCFLKRLIQCNYRCLGMASGHSDSEFGRDMGDTTTEQVFELARELFPDCIELHLDQISSGYWWILASATSIARLTKGDAICAFTLTTRNFAQSQIRPSGALCRQLRILAGNDD